MRVQRAVWRQNKLARDGLEDSHADARRSATLEPGPADYDTYLRRRRRGSCCVGREAAKSFSEAKIEEQKWTPGAGAYDTTTPLSQVGGALGREKRGGAFAAESDDARARRGCDAELPSARSPRRIAFLCPAASHETRCLAPPRV